jgi:hypothetical protein
LGKNTATVQKEKATLLASKEGDLEVDTEKIKMCMFHEHNAGKNHNIKKASKSSENVAEVQIFENDTDK